MTPWLTFFLLDFQIYSQWAFYQVITDDLWIFWTVMVWLGFILILSVYTCSISCSSKVKYRLSYLPQTVNIYRWTFWTLEFLMIPVAFNLGWVGTCTFKTERHGVQLATCNMTAPEVPWRLTKFWDENWGFSYQWILFVFSFVGYGAALVYNGFLLRILEDSKISTMFHEDFIEKKEIEYSLGINRIWATDFFFTFSSFRSGPLRMYYRLIMNIWSLLLIALSILAVST